MTEDLKSTLVNVEYQKNNKTVAKAVHFAGYIGVITGIKQVGAQCRVKKVGGPRRGGVKISNTLRLMWNTRTTKMVVEAVRTLQATLVLLLQ